MDTRREFCSKLATTGMVFVLCLGNLSAQGDAVQAMGHVHTALGQASVTIEMDPAGRRRLEVRNLGSSGQDGVAITRPILSQPGDGNGDSIELAFDSTGVGPSSTLSARARVATGDVDGDAVEVRCVHNGAAVDVSSSVLDPKRFSSTRYVELLQDGKPVASRIVEDDDPFAQILIDPAASSLAWPLDLHFIYNPTTDQMTTVITFNGEVGYGQGLTRPPSAGGQATVLMGGEVTQCDAISVAVDAAGTSAPGVITAALIRASNLESLTINDECTAFGFHNWRWPGASRSRLPYHSWRWPSTGVASMSVSTDPNGMRRLEVRNIGASGQDGVDLPRNLFQADTDGDGIDEPLTRGGFEMAFETTGNQTGSSIEARIRVAQGDVEGDGVSVRCLQTEDALELSSTLLFPGLFEEKGTVHLLRGGIRVAKGDLSGDGIFARVLSPAGTRALPRLKDLHIGWDHGSFVFELSFDGVLSARSGIPSSAGVTVEAAGQVVVCDRVALKLTSASGAMPVLPVLAQLRMSRLESFTVLDASSTFEFDGLPHHTLGEAAFELPGQAGERRLPVRNLGASGQDGVGVSLRSLVSQPGDASGDGYALAYSLEGFREGSALEAHAIVSQQGEVNGDGRFRLEQHGAGFDLSVFGFEPAPLSAASLRLHGALGGVFIGGVDLSGDGFAGRVVADPSNPIAQLALPRDVHIWWDWVSLTWCIRFSWDGNVGSTLRTADSAPLIGLELDGRVVACDSVVLEVQSSKLPMSSPGFYFGLTAANVDVLTILDESATLHFAGFEHHSLGQASVSVSNDPATQGLSVANIGSSGQDGVSIVADLDRDGRADLLGGYEIAFEATGVRDGSQMTARAKGTIKGGHIGGGGSINVSVEASDGGVGLKAQFHDMNLMSYVKRQAVALQGGVVVAAADLDGDGVARVLSSSDSPGQIPWPKDIHIVLYPVFEIRFTWDRILSAERQAGGGGSAPELTVELGGQVVVCDSIALRLVGASGLPEAFSDVDLVAASLESFTILGESALPPTPPAQEILRGDSNNDGAVDIGDGIWTLSYLFTGGRAPPCTDAADANDTGDLDLSDAIFVLNFLFLGGREPPPPGARTCGVDPTADNLDCEVVPAACKG